MHNNNIQQVLNSLILYSINMETRTSKLVLFDFNHSIPF